MFGYSSMQIITVETIATLPGLANSVRTEKQNGQQQKLRTEDVRFTLPQSLVVWLMNSVRS